MARPQSTVQVQTVTTLATSGWTRGGPAIALVLAGLWGGEAAAGGLSAARFGGEHGHPTADNPTAIYYNPAGIAESRGTRIFVDGTMVLRWASYERPASAVSNEASLEQAPGANDGRATLFNTLAAPFVGVTSDFGSKIFTAGAAFYFPFGGQAVWDQNDAYAGDKRFPGAVDGVQRWYTIDGTIRSMYLTGAVALKIPNTGLSLGVTGSAIKSGVHTIRARNPDGTDDLLTGNSPETYMLKEGRSLIDVEGWQGGFSFGLLYNLRDKLWIGASYTSQPNVAGGMRLNGTLTNVFALGAPTTSNVEMTQSLPDIIRLGFRVRPIPRLELRLFADYSRWSVMERQCVMNLAEQDRNCDYGSTANVFTDPASYGSDLIDEETGAPITRGVVQHLPRFWKDTGGVRLGASYWFLDDRIEAYLGAGYDSSAVPVQTIDAALMDMNKATVSLGARFQIVRQFALALTATEVIFQKVDTKGENVLDKFSGSTKQAGADGVYRQFFQLVNLYADIRF